MPKLENYEKVLVEQKNLLTGCIPTSIEWMMRYKGITVTEDFQEEYDLEKKGKAENTFESISTEILKNKFKIKFEIKDEKDFPDGKQKFKYIEKLISKQIPCLISITLEPVGNWHIVPVVEIHYKSVYVLSMNGTTIEVQLKRYPRGGLEWAHNHWPGGKDILALI